MGHFMTEDKIQMFCKRLVEEEKAKATISKYMYDIDTFCAYIGRDEEVSKERVIDYKESLMRCYSPNSVNSKLAALNSFFKEMGWYDCIVKSLKIQKEAFRSQNRELSKAEYYRLLEAAKNKNNMRLYFLMQTICATGIRVGELQFITVEALKEGRARVSLKGKTRTVLLPKILCRRLNAYAKEKRIRSGSIFVTSGGRPLDRSNICHAMKALCEEAGVQREKIFPHNLRHLFACTYYGMEKDLSHLADLLGHSNVNTTRIYTLNSEAEQARQIEVLGFVV